MFFVEHVVMKYNEDENFRFTMWNRIGGILFWPLVVIFVIWGFLQGFLGK
jgi:hypothetical protein